MVPKVAPCDRKSEASQRKPTHPSQLEREEDRSQNWTFVKERKRAFEGGGEKKRKESAFSERRDRDNSRIGRSVIGEGIGKSPGWKGLEGGKGEAGSKLLTSPVSLDVKAFLSEALVVCLDQLLAPLIVLSKLDNALVTDFLCFLQQGENVCVCVQSCRVESPPLAMLCTRTFVSGHAQQIFFLGLTSSLTASFCAFNEKEKGKEKGKETVT